MKKNNVQATVQLQVSPRMACPSCKTAFPDTPARPRKCRACGTAIIYRNHEPLTADQVAARAAKDRARREAVQAEREAARREWERPKCSGQGLKDRGWTDAMIRRFLPEPDVTAVNPYHKSGPPMRLYYVSRIEAIEQTDEFLSARAVASKRQEAAQRAVQTKIDKLLAQVDDFPRPVLPDLDQEELTRHAVENYNSKEQDVAIERGFLDTKSATVNADQNFLNRISVNYARHCLTSYHDRLYLVAGNVGTREAYNEVKRRIHAAIAKAYPWLARECKRQLLDSE